ncbi:MAG: 3-methyl-2-oxobutanoate hydroxymethyltransferase [Thermodesulfobacteriota bacterium]
MSKKITLQALQSAKAAGEKLAMLTAYDYPSAQLADAAGLDLILVGDSLGMVVLGYDSTVRVTIEEMLHHTKAVVRGTQRAFVITDMPFLSYQISPETAVANAGRLFKEGGCDAVKLEGGVNIVPQVEALTQAGIPVCGHIGLTPQTATQLSGYKVQGRNREGAMALVEQARALEAAGAVFVVLECVPREVAARITRQLRIPTIGIGAGIDCDGQVLVTQDILGIFDHFCPKFVKQYADLKTQTLMALKQYREEVKAGQFPGPEQSFFLEGHVRADFET